MKKATLFRFVLIALVMCTDLSAAGPLDELLENGNGVRARRDCDGKLWKLTGPITAPSKERPTEIAIRFLETYGAGLVPNGEIDISRVRASAGPSGARISAQVTFAGIPVFNAEVMVHVLNDGSIDGVEVPVLPRITRMVSSSLNAARAEQSALRLLGAIYGPCDFPTSSRLVYHAADESLRLCWQVQALSPAGTWLFLVSAEVPGMTYAVKRLAMDAITGKGKVYMENPIATKDPVKVDLTHLGRSHSLVGSCARTYNANGKEIFTDGFHMGRYTTAASAEDTYVYGASDMRFEEVMSYYHITRTHDYLVNNHLASGVPGTIPIIVNLRGDAGFYTRDPRFPSTGIIGLGAGHLFYNFSMDADVIVHEYGHAVLDYINPGFASHYEHVYSGAIHEATGDSLACQMSGNSKMGEYATRFRATGKWIGENIHNKRRYPDDVDDPERGEAEVHHTGLIACGMFWQMRKTLGPDKAIALYFDALHRLGPHANFFDLRDGLLLADKALYDGTDATTLGSIFADRGLQGQDPGNKSGKATILSMQTRHFDIQNWKVLDKAESFQPGSWIALMANVRITNSSPGYYVIPRINVLFPPDVGDSGYEWYGVTPTARSGEREYLQGVLCSPINATSATLKWTHTCRLGMQTKYTERKVDSFKIE
ncbi:MAG: M36 family metallopeptidase [Acidobacteriota bacterium]